jgi:acyl-CoA synthetase (NDP forming)
MPAPEKLRDPRSLRRLLTPRSLAVVGVSAEPTGFGARAVQNMAGFDGPVWCVNPKYAGQELHGRPCFASIAELPGSPDATVLALPRAGVMEGVKALGARRAGGVVIFASGYGETGIPERIEEERVLRETARALDLPIIGANCLGFCDHTQRAGATFMPDYAKMTAPAGGVGVVSQSGAMGYALMQAAERGFAMCHMATAGNATDLDVCDLAAFQLSMPECRSIALVVEGLRDARRLFELGALARDAGKAIVVLKLGRGEAGAQAAMSHTGSLAGSAAAWSAGFKRAGLLEVEDFDALLETAGFLAKAPPPLARGIGIVTPSGGAGIMAADHAEFLGLDLPQPSAETEKLLRATIPEFGSPRNPCDMTAQVATNSKLFEDCMNAMLADPAYAAIIMPVVYHNRQTTPVRMRLLEEMSARSGKPICIEWITESLEGPGPEAVDSAPHIALFRSARRMMNAMRLWFEHHAPRPAPRPAPGMAPAGVPKLPEGEVTLMEAEAKAAFARAGLRIAPERQATTVEEAVRAAWEIGYPVVLKLDSSDVAHKTEVGGVRLDLRDAAAVRTAFAAIAEGVARHAPGAHMRGVLVQRMEARGVELILGARRDPQFGPMVLVGLGGVQAELWKDVALDLAPVSKEGAMAMLRSLRAFPLLDGFRGAAKADVAALAEAIARFSAFAAACGDRLEEAEINPLLCRPDGCVAVDGLLRLAG